MFHPHTVVLFFFFLLLKCLQISIFCQHNLYFFRLDFYLLHFSPAFPCFYLTYSTNVFCPPYLFASHTLLPFLSEKTQYVLA